MTIRVAAEPPNSIRFYELDLWELFDLEKDPQEMHSVYDDPAYQTVRDQMTRRLQQQRRLYEVGLAQE